MKKYYTLSIALWSAILIGMLVGSFHEARWKGDSNEYMLYTLAFATHLSADFSREDITYAKNINKKLVLDTFASIGNGNEFGRKAQYDNKGYVRASNGQVYSWHFWLYSLFATPFFKLSQWMGFQPIYSFIICNWVFVFLVLGYLASRWKGTLCQKHILAVLFISSGTTYYIWWPHPEVFTASLLLLALMSVTDRRHILSMFCVALAATQNPPLLFLQAAIVGKAVIDRDIFRFNPISINIKNNYLVLLAIAGSFIIALSPVIFFEYILGVSNPIIAAGWSNVKLISWSRLLSLFFDLNQGMLVATPGLFLGIFFILLIAIFFRNRLGSAWILPLFIGILISVIMSIPALSTAVWSHGQSVFSRYAYWLSVPISFGLTFCLRSLSRRFIFSLGAIVIICQIITMAYYGVWGKNWRSDDSEFKPVASYVLLNYPWLYNPVPDIFIDRLTHNVPINNRRRVYQYPNGNKPSKILVQAGELYEVEQNLRQQCNNISYVLMESEWVYLNVHCSGINNR